MDADEPISVTVDASDLTGASAEPLKAVIARYGRPISARAFADFQQTSLAELSVQLYQLGFTLVHCPTWPNGDGFPKPVVTDILAMDLRDQLEELEGIETFIIVATSREYIAVANSLRRHDKRVIVVAEEAKVSRELKLCADEFVVLPPTKVERAAVAPRAPRATTRTPISRPDRVVEAPRPERAPEVARIERLPEPVRIEKAPEPVARVERVIERPVERPVERTAEPVREVARSAEPQEARLPSDSDIVAEVRKIIAAEGICTPRRLARALCPVDRTPTGELRSRISNRIQTLIDSGRLLREKLVVGGTSVETIVVGEDRDGRAGHSAPDAAPAQPVHEDGDAAKEAPNEVATAVVSNRFRRSSPAAAKVSRSSEVEEAERRTPSPVQDLDAFVESVLRASDTAVLRPAEQVAVEATADEPVSQEADAPAESPAKRPRSRRRSPSKKTAADKSAAPEAEAAS